MHHISRLLNKGNGGFNQPPILKVDKIMRKDEKKHLEEIINVLENQRDFLMDLCEIENEKFDNMNEGLQATERGQRIYENAGVLEEQSDSLDNIIEELRELLD